MRDEELIRKVRQLRDRNGLGYYRIWKRLQEQGINRSVHTIRGWASDRRRAECV